MLYRPGAQVYLCCNLPAGMFQRNQLQYGYFFFGKLLMISHIGLRNGTAAIFKGDVLLVR